MKVSSFGKIFARALFYVWLYKRLHIKVFWVVKLSKATRTRIPDLSPKWNNILWTLSTGKQKPLFCNQYRNPDYKWIFKICLPYFSFWYLYFFIVLLLDAEFWWRVCELPGLRNMKWLCPVIIFSFILFETFPGHQVSKYLYANTRKNSRLNYFIVYVFEM